VTIIIASVLGAVGFSAMFVMALMRAASIADAAADRALAEPREERSVAGYEQSYAGFAWAQPTIVRESSITQPLRLHVTVSVPSMPAWRWPGTEQ
jgi:phage-related baseplate assembly protein